MAQFTAYVFSDGLRYRVVVEGLGSDFALSLFGAEDAARRLIDRQVRASYPDRLPAAPGDALGYMTFTLEIVRADGRRQRRELWVQSGRRARTAGEL